MSKQPTCSAPGSRAAVRATPASAAAWCSGAQAASVRSSATHGRRSSRTGPSWSGPPCTIRCPTTSGTGSPAPSYACSAASSGSPDPADRRGAARHGAVVSSTVPSCSAGTSARASGQTSPSGPSANSAVRTDDEPRLTARATVTTASSPGPRACPPGARRCTSRAERAGVAAGSSRRGRTGDLPGRPAQRLAGQVVAAHAVEDHHVERRGRGALLGEAAHVEPVRRAAGRAAAGAPPGRSRGTPSPRASARGNSSSKTSVGEAVRVHRRGGISAIRSTTLTTRTDSSGTCSRSSCAAASISRVGTSPVAAEHHVRPAGALSLPAQCQTPSAAGAVLAASSAVEVLQVRLLVDDDAG